MDYTSPSPLGSLCGLFFWSLVGAIFLRAAAKWVAKEEVPYWSAVGTVFLIMLSNAVVAFVAGAIVASLEKKLSQDVLPLYVTGLITVFFAIQSLIISARVKTSFGTACLVTLTMGALTLVTAVVVGGVVYLVMQAR